MSARLSSLRRLPGAGRVLRALGLGGVPATGYFGAGWSVGTLLLLYWLETILVTAVVSFLIVCHRRSTRKAGHWSGSVAFTSGGKTTIRSATFLQSFLGVMVPFTLVHGVFVAAFAFLVFPQELGPPAGVSADAVTDGLTAIAVFLLASLLFDLPGIGARPFHWVERLANRAQGRMIVTHLTIILGAGAMFALDAPLGFLVVFVGLKSLLDLGGMLPDRPPKPQASRAVKALGRRLPKKEGTSFDQHYEAAIAAELAKRDANEQVRPGPRVATS